MGIRRKGKRGLKQESGRAREGEGGRGEGGEWDG